MCMEGIEVFAKNEKQTGDYDTSNKNMLPVYRNGI